MGKDNFKEKLNQFINQSQNTYNSNIKSEYLKLVKEFHPDINKEIKNETANEYMIIINYVYENLINKKTGFKLLKEDEYEKQKINGKYCFINEFGIKEYISEKVLFVFKLGKLEYTKATTIMLENPVYTGNKEKTGYEIIGHLYRAYKYFKDVIKMDRNGNWGKNALINLHYAFKMNEHITRGLQISNEKELANI
ncbi:MAG: J domain-containing protein [Treponema sp.]|nr:J domain-containing protein [Treponema sp.]